MPFCSRRCYQIDLKRWLSEQYGLPDESMEVEPDWGENGGGQVEGSS